MLRFLICWILERVFCFECVEMGRVNEMVRLGQMVRLGEIKEVLLVI